METKIITDTSELENFCERQCIASYITVDTEFIRDHTYWPKLCLLQVAGPNESALLDPLSPVIDMAPFFNLLVNSDVLKVFHAARQDFEIFFNLTGQIPTPVFDTQVAAMVCGFGDQVSYEKLVAQIAGNKIDKASRFTDWARRPLSTKQLAYALADVTHLRPVYEQLANWLEESGRSDWLNEEMGVLTNPGTYLTRPEDAWQRVKNRNGNARFQAVLKEIAAWREREAQSRDTPRGRILRDEVLISIASNSPKSVEELNTLRGLPKRFVEGHGSAELIEAVSRALAIPSHELPRVIKRKAVPASVGPLIDLLKVLLKHVCEVNNVAPKLVASTEDLERIALSNDDKLAVLKGWRGEIFGQQALALKKGRLGMKINGTRIELQNLDNE